MAGNLLMSISQNQVERARFRSRMKYETDQQSNIATAEDRGERRGQIKIARQGLLMKLPVADIAKLTGLTIEEIDRLRTEEDATS